MQLELLEPRCVLATFVVNDASDVANNDPALTNLREAIELANTSPGPDNIEFDSAMVGQTIFASNGQLDLLDDVTIVGPGANLLTVDGESKNRLFRISSGVTAEISGMTLNLGAVRNQNGGAISNQGELVLKGVVVRNSFVMQDAAANQFGGAGIYNDDGAELTLIRTEVVGMFSQGDGGGILNRGSLTLRDGSIVANNQANFGAGGISSLAGSVTVIDSVIERNVALQGSGGGIRFGGDLLSFVDSFVRDNSASGWGGGVWVGVADALSINGTQIHGNSALWGAGVYSAVPTTIQRSTLYDNSAGSGGGALYVDVNSEVTLENSTVSGNRSNGRGGGIWNSGSLLSLNTTIAANSADDDGFEGADTGGGISNSGRAVLHNTIVAGNTETSGGFFGSDVTGKSLDAESSYNLIGTRGSGGLRDGVNGNIVTAIHGMEVDPESQRPRLKNNGGTTPTHLLLPNSPAVDAGSDQFDPFLDQRGRPITDVDGVGSSSVDIGSYELQQFALSNWKSEVNDASQFGPGEALVHGFGFDDGDPNSSVQKRPEFVGFQFDTGALSFGDIVDGPFGSKWGGELRADFAGRFGLDLGFYINSGSVDVNYDGTLNYIIDDPGGNQPIRIDTVLNVDDGSLYTISPKVGAYADLVLELNARAGATGCVWACVGGDVGFKVDERFELFSINRQEQDRDDIDGDGNRREPLFYDPNGLETTNSQGAVTPVLDGDIRIAFSQLIEDALEDTKEKVRDARAARQLQKADKEERRGNIDVEEGRRELNKSDNDADRAKARQKIIDGQSKVSNAQVRRARATGKMVKRKLGGTPKAGIGVSFSEASGSLLGVEATVSAGVGVDGVASVSKELGTMTVTLPDINLRDVDADRQGTLSASTRQFPVGSDLDQRRQLARMSIDIGGILGPLIGLPAGKYSVDIGPLGVEIQTVSYNIIPQLDVTQDVQVTPYAKQYVFDFDREVVVDLNGVTMGSVNSVRFNPTDTIEVHANGEPVTVTPTLMLGNRLTNKIGLDVDVVGVFEAFSLGLSVFGEEIVGLGPLITHEQRFGTISLGNVFDQTFDLTASGQGEGLVLNQALTPFTIGLPMTGLSPGTPLPLAGDATVDVQAREPLFLATRLLDQDVVSEQAMFFQDVTYDLQNNQATSILVLSDGLTLTLNDGQTIALQKAVRYDFATPESSFQISGFDAASLGESPNALIGVIFATSGSVDIATLRANPIDVTVQLTDTDSENRGGIDKLEASKLRPTVSLSADIDGDGRSSPLTDGVLLVRYLRGQRGDSLIRGAISPTGDRSTSEEVVRYIEDVLMQETTDDQTGEVLRPLDIDRDGVVGDATDAVLLARYLAGFTEEALVFNAIGPLATRQNADEIVAYLDNGIVTTNNETVVLVDDLDQTRVATGIGFEIDEIVDRRDRDRFGVDGRDDVDADASAGSSAAAADTQIVSGAAPAAAHQFDHVEPVAAKTVYQYALETFGETVTYDAYYLDSAVPENLISRVAQGSPMRVSDQSELVDLLAKLEPSSVDDLDSRIVKRQDAKVLGVQDPIFIQAPDAAGYTYQAFDGYQFKTIEFDTNFGGNLYLNPEFDLYLFDEQRNDWVYESTLSSSTPYQFAGRGVDRFQLFGLALPNESLHRAGNLAAPGTRVLPDGTTVRDLATTVGFTFFGFGNPLMIQLTEEAPRQTLATPDLVDDPECQTNCPAASNEDALFYVVRNGANAETTVRRYVDGTPIESLAVMRQQLDPLSSSTGLFFEGDSFVDVVVLDSAGGPIRLPIRFDAGGGADELIVQGANIGLDFVARDHISGVEQIDIRGAGSNSLTIDAQVVLNNTGTGSVLIVRADSDDVITVNSGWIAQGTEIIDGETFSIFVHSGATIKLSADASLTAALPSVAVGERAAKPMPRRFPFEPEGSPSSLPFDRSQNRDDPRERDSLELAQRTIRSAQPDPLAVVRDEAFSIPVLYETEPDATSTGLHLRIHYDSSKLRFEGVSDIYAPSFAAQEIAVDGPCLGEGELLCYGYDGNAETDKYVQLLWLDVQGNWPGDVEPIQLLQANFTAIGSLQNETVVEFSGSSAAGLELDSVPVVVRQRLQPGDFDSDGVVNVNDIRLMCGQLGDGNTDLKFDLTSDGVIDSADREFLIRQILGTNYGDANLDGRFNSKDLINVLQRGEYEDDVTGNSTWETGDWDCDGEFGSADFVLALSAGAYSAQSLPVQPSSPLIASAIVTVASERIGRGGSRTLTTEDQPVNGRRHIRSNRLMHRDLIFAGDERDREPSVDRDTSGDTLNDTFSDAFSDSNIRVVIAEDLLDVISS